MKNKKQNRMVAPIIISIMFIALTIGMIIFYFWIKSVSGISPIFPVAISLLYVLPIVGIIIALVQRIKEIKGGEEDEASKY